MLAVAGVIFGVLAIAVIAFLAGKHSGSAATSPASTTAPSPLETTMTTTSIAATTTMVTATTQVLDCIAANTPQIQPAYLQLGCGSGGESVVNITWKTWSPLEAYGEGTYQLNDCQPSCSQGNYHKFPAAVQLSNPVSSPYGFLFSLMDVHPTSGFGGYFEWITRHIPS
jgi:heme/copper-type cytochrome/quinol oxidase subunit 2